jgi:DnaA N-terminal domain
MDVSQVQVLRFAPGEKDGKCYFSPRRSVNRTPMQDTYSQIWREIASGIRLQLSADAFQRWFAAIELVQADEIALTFQVPNTIYQFWIESNYLNVVQSAAMSVLGSPREIKFRAADSGMTGPVVDVHADRVSETLVPTSQDEDSEGAMNHGMNPGNRFEAFVVGSNNQFAHAAALAISQSIRPMPCAAQNMSFKKDKTPVLAADEARTLLDSIPIVKAAAEDGAAADRPDFVGLRDRALIGLMAYSFARVGAVLQMKVGDYFVQERRRWVRLHEKAARSMTFPVTTILITSWTNISPRPVSPTMPAVICFERQYASQASSRKNPCTSKTPTA